jgi:hypothetical protein
MYSFKNLTLEINGIVRQFDFEYLKESMALQLCTITSEGQFLVINKNLAVVSTDMPENWVNRAIQKLAELLENEVTDV